MCLLLFLYLGLLVKKQKKKNLVLETDYTHELVGSGGTPDSVNPSVVDEYEGLPSPPLDGLFFATQPTSIELSQVRILFHIC